MGWVYAWSYTGYIFHSLPILANMGQQFFIVRFGLLSIRSAWTASDTLCRDKPVEVLLELRRCGRRKVRQSPWPQEPYTAEDRWRTDMLPEMSTHRVDTQKAEASPRTSMCGAVCWDSLFDSKVRGANMGPFWAESIQVGPMLALRSLLSGLAFPAVGLCRWPQSIYAKNSELVKDSEHYTGVIFWTLPTICLGFCVNLKDGDDGGVFNYPKWWWTV